jgi:hypothetical protein
MAGAFFVLGGSMRLGGGISNAAALFHFGNSLDFKMTLAPCRKPDDTQQTGVTAGSKNFGSAP